MAPSEPRPRRSYVLRIPPELYEAYEAWAADEFRSMNAQFAAVLTDAARRAGRLPRPRPSERGRSARGGGAARREGADSGPGKEGAPDASARDEGSPGGGSEAGVDGTGE